jgi:hypothetical protein
MLVTTSASTPVPFLNVLYFTSPESTTYLTPGIVTDVSAMFVDRMIFLKPTCVGTKTLF